MARGKSSSRLAVIAAAVWIAGAGLLGYRAGWHVYLRAAVAFLIGDSGGCSWASIGFHPELDRRYKAVAASSRLLESTPDGLRRIQTPLGAFWAPKDTDAFYVVAEQLLRIYGDGPYRVRKGDIVLDCGANIGAFTREALSAGAELVVAIEPVPHHVESMRRTFHSEIAAGCVILVPKGVWHKEDRLKMRLYKNSVLDSFVMTRREEEPGTVPVEVELPLTTIDGIVRDLKLRTVDFIKMDIEGAEREALEGARAAIAGFRPRMSIATENVKDDYLAVPRLVDQIAAGYQRVCGACRLAGGLTIRPDVLYFQP